MMAVFFFIAHEKGLKLAHILVLVSWLNQWFKLDQSRIMSLSGFHGFLLLRPIIRRLVNKLDLGNSCISALIFSEMLLS